MSQVYWTVRENGQGLVWAGSAARFFQLYVLLTPSNSGGRGISLESIEYRVDFGGRNFWPWQSYPIGGSEQATYAQWLPLPFDPHLIEEIERANSGHKDLTFNALLNIRWREVTKIPLPSVREDHEESLMVRSYGEATMEQRPLTIQLNRDRWLEILRSIGWENFEIFEVPTAGLRQIEPLAKGLEILRQAEAAYHRHEWRDVVQKSRLSCVTAAAEAAPGSGTPEGYAALFKKAFPDEVDGAKRKLLDQLSRSLADFRAEAEHPTGLGMQYDRRDAEMALTVALSIFRYLGDALAKR